MAQKGRPKSNKNATKLWIVEQFYHGDELTQSWGKPIKVCHSKEDAMEKLEFEIDSYINSLEEFSYVEVDRSISDMVTVKLNPDSIYPSMDFWYYSCLLIDPEEE